MQKIICFYNADEQYGFMSNWYPADFTIDGRTYTSTEQFMMYQKAILFGDAETAEEILSTNNLGKIKSLGRLVRNYNDTIWNGVRQIIVYRGVLEKFRQNPSLKAQLLATAPHTLAECSSRDKLWGIGIPIDDDARFDLDLWEGKNLLGFTLMQVREQLQKEP